MSVAFKWILQSGLNTSLSHLKLKPAAQTKPAKCGSISPIEISDTISITRTELFALLFPNTFHPVRIFGPTTKPISFFLKNKCAAILIQTGQTYPQETGSRSKTILLQEKFTSMDSIFTGGSISTTVTLSI